MTKQKWIKISAWAEGASIEDATVEIDIPDKTEYTRVNASEPKEVEMSKDRSEEVRGAILEAIDKGISDTESLLQVTRNIAPNHEWVLRDMKNAGVIRGTVKADGKGGVVHRYHRVTVVNNG